MLSGRAAQLCTARRRADTTHVWQVGLVVVVVAPSRGGAAAVRRGEAGAHQPTAAVPAEHPARREAGEGRRSRRDGHEGGRRPSHPQR